MKQQFFKLAYINLKSCLKSQPRLIQSRQNPQTAWVTVALPGDKNLKLTQRHCCHWTLLIIEIGAVGVTFKLCALRCVCRVESASLHLECPGFAFCAWYSERSRIIQIPCLTAIILSIKSRHVNGIRQIYVHFLLLFTARATPFESAVVRRVSLLCRFLRTCVVETNEKYFPTHICILIERNNIIAVKFLFHCFLCKHQIRFNSALFSRLGVDEADNREKTFVAQLNNFQMGWNKCRAMWTENWDNQKRRFVPPARRGGVRRDFPNEKESLMCRII